MTDQNYNYIEGSKHPIYAWTKGVPVDEGAEQQLRNIANMPFIHHHVAVMPDVHFGLGATIGSVIPTKGAIIPAAVGVDIGCGMMAVRLDGLNAKDLPDSLKQIRSEVEHTVPVGFKSHRDPPNVNHSINVAWQEMDSFIQTKHPKITSKRKDSTLGIIGKQYGTLGGGNHFVELCLDKQDGVWVMLHSGSRGIGNTIGQYFINLAKKDMERHFINLPDQNLSYLTEGTESFNDYVYAVNWAQDYARGNREEMMRRILIVLHRHLPPFKDRTEAVNCHHNYVEIENHYGANVYVTRKGAVRAREGDMGIIPGSMGARSYIVRGLGNPSSFNSCSHGAGRIMSRKEAKRRISLKDHERATEGVECRKDSGVIDESPAAYKAIEDVMAAQKDLVEIVYELKQVMCVKG